MQCCKRTEIEKTYFLCHANGSIKLWFSIFYAFILKAGTPILLVCKYVIALCIFICFPLRNKYSPLCKPEKNMNFDQFLSVFRFTGYCAKKRWICSGVDIHGCWLCVYGEKGMCVRVCKRWLGCKNSPFALLHTLISLSQTCTVVFMPWQNKITTK